MSCGKTFLTEDILAMIGTEAEQIEVTLSGIEKEGLRRFNQALMDPDPRFWDEDFAKSTRYGEITTPSIFVTYLSKTHPSAADPVTRAFKNNPVSDGIGGMDRGRPGQLP
ncbi:MAG: MaoC family dehydratase N-terminal domain-containing protein, partial [Chloroflexi bacterium]|nr:MaoC family dehydratase N-terminal domain-containing protein [Chloroflexota bacterium]